MKLFLTSSGLKNNVVSGAFLGALTKPIVENKVLVVSYTQDPNEEFYVNQSVEELKELGFKNVQVVNMHHNFNIRSLGQFEVVYVCGGNTFAILNKLKETELVNFISKAVNAGSIYVGVSAGSIIACKSIEIAGWGSEGDKNKIGLKDLNGLNFVNISVFPHFREELNNEVEEFRRTVAHGVYPIADGVAVFINGNDIVTIGQ